MLIVWRQQLRHGGVIVLILLLLIASKVKPAALSYTVSLQILLLMSALTLLPALLMLMTSFTRIIIVFSILRQALGLQQTPSNQVMIGLALFLTLFIMTPVFNQVYDGAIVPYQAEQISTDEAVDKAIAPFRSFMFSQMREDDLSLFIKLSGRDFQTLDEIPFSIYAPAFITSELKTAFQMGFLIFIPFLVIDLVVASVLMAMGMMMLSPIIISLPFKNHAVCFSGWVGIDYR